MVVRRSIQRLRVKRRRLFRLNAAQDTRARAIQRGSDLAFTDEGALLRKTFRATQCQWGHLGRPRTFSGFQLRIFSPLAINVTIRRPQFGVG